MNKFEQTFQKIFKTNRYKVSLETSNGEKYLLHESEDINDLKRIFMSKPMYIVFEDAQKEKASQKYQLLK